MQHKQNIKTADNIPKYVVRFLNTFHALLNCLKTKTRSKTLKKMFFFQLLIQLQVN